MRRAHTIRRIVVWGLTLLAVGPVTSAPAGAQGPPTVPVRYTPVRQHQVRRTVQLTGSVESRRISVVASEVEGVVEALEAREGDRVQRGQSLVRLRRTNLQLRMQAVRGQLKEAEARQSLAQTSMERTRGLFEEQIISRQQLDDAISEFEAWQGRVEQLQAEVARLEDDLSRTTVRAPFAGIVVRELIAVGEWLAAGGGVVELLDFEDLEVTVEAPEGSFSGLQAGGAAHVVIASVNNLEVEGRVRAIVPRADDQARTFPVKISIANPDGKIAVGMLARVHLPVGVPENALIVPKDAIVEQGDQAVVFRIGEQGTVERVNVETGSAAGAWIAVTGDLAAGDRIVTRGNERIFPGQAVEAEVLEYELP